MSNEIVQKINIAKIKDPAQPMRTELEREKIQELADSIKCEGLINPITVRPVGDMYEVVAGHRRFKACAIAGVFEIPCVVRELTDEQVFGVMAHENLYRQDVDPVDEAIFVARLVKEQKMSVSSIAEKLNRSENWVQSRLAIIDFPDDILVVLKEGQISLGVAEHLAAIKDDFWRAEYLEQCLKNGMSIATAKYIHAQYDCGLMPSAEKLQEEAANFVSGPRPLCRAQCARCGKEAVEPNLTNVFVHRECLADEPAAAV